MEWHDNKTGDELAEAERRLRERLESLNIEQQPNSSPLASDDFWASTLIASVIAISVLCVIYLIYLGAGQ